MSSSVAIGIKDSSTLESNGFNWFNVSCDFSISDAFCCLINSCSSNVAVNLENDDVKQAKNVMRSNSLLPQF